VWLQWPQIWEVAFEPSFAAIVATVLEYEDVHILTHDSGTRQSAVAALTSMGGLTQEVAEGAANAAGFAITWHMISNDSAWMRDNGPVYVLDDGEMRIQNWEFDAWGGAFGMFPFGSDNAVPDAVGAALGMPVDPVGIVHERGNLEFNGSDGVLLNWTVIGDPNRNPGITQDDVVLAMETYFGVSRVVLVEGAPTGDLTGGHIDGIARFIDENTVVVADCSANSLCQPGDRDDQLYDDAAAAIEAAGFSVVRWPFESQVDYRNATFDTDYMNWIVGNGFVITVGFDAPTADANAKAQLETWFPGRDVYVIEMLESWYQGGGVHCHTNDQPASP
jgi:agmatine deiminase